MSEEFRYEIVRNDDSSEYQAIADVDGIDTIIGEIRFAKRPAYMDCYHTGTVPEVAGKGVGKALAQFALEDIRKHGEKIFPRCPFLAKYIENHPEYQDLVIDA